MLFRKFFGITSPSEPGSLAPLGNVSPWRITAIFALGYMASAYILYFSAFDGEIESSMQNR